MNEQEKKARDEALPTNCPCCGIRQSKLYKKRDGFFCLSCGSEFRWDARADWQAKRENSPDIRADNVMSIEDHACNTGDCDHYFQKDCDKTLAAYRDAQARDSSAEFPEALANARFKELYRVDNTGSSRDAHRIECYRWLFIDGYREGFERGRAAAQIEIANAYHESDLLIEKLADLQAEIERLRSHSNEK